MVPSGGFLLLAACIVWGGGGGLSMPTMGRCNRIVVNKKYFFFYKFLTLYKNRVLKSIYNSQANEFDAILNITFESLP